MTYIIYPENSRPHCLLILCKHIDWIIHKWPNNSAHATVVAPYLHQPNDVIIWVAFQPGREFISHHYMMTSSNGNIFRVTALCAGNSPVPGDFPAQRPVTRSFDLRLNKRLSKQSWGWWFETLPRPSWRHSNEVNGNVVVLTKFSSLVALEVVILTTSGYKQWWKYHQNINIPVWVKCMSRHGVIHFINS